MKLTIMILSLPNRLKLLNELLNELEKQSNGLPIEILYLGDNQMIPIGTKRNILKRYAQGEYSTWIDDDDFIHPQYIDNILKGIEKNPDVICWTNQITIGGYNMIPHPIVEKCHFSILHTELKKDFKNKIYYYMPCHINPIKHSISSKFDFDECSYCKADSKWMMDISKLLKTEYIIPEVMYYHRYGFSNDRAKAPKTGGTS